MTDIDDVWADLERDHDARIEREQAEFQQSIEPLVAAGMTPDQITVAVEFTRTYLEQARDAHEKTMAAAITRLGLVWSEERKRWIWPPRKRRES